MLIRAQSSPKRRSNSNTGHQKHSESQPGIRVHFLEDVCSLPSYRIADGLRSALCSSSCCCYDKSNHGANSDSFYLSSACSRREQYNRCVCVFRSGSAVECGRSCEPDHLSCEKTKEKLERQRRPTSAASSQEARIRPNRRRNSFENGGFSRPCIHIFPALHHSS